MEYLPQACKQSAWGTGFFESLYDLLMATLLSIETDGLVQLQNQDRVAQNDQSLCYRLYARQCSPSSSIARVRSHLEPGTLQKLHDKYFKLAVRHQPIGLGHPPINFKYAITLLGACSISIGYPVSAQMIAEIKIIGPLAGLKGDAQKQFQKAFYGGPGGGIDFSPGTPYDWGSKSHQEVLDEGGSMIDFVPPKIDMKPLSTADCLTLQAPSEPESIIEMFGNLFIDQKHARWGVGIFDNNKCLQEVNCLSIQAGLFDLQEEDNKATGGQPVYYSLFRPLCLTTPDTVRAYLNDRMLPWLHNRYHHEAELNESLDAAAVAAIRARALLLIMCALSHGCEVPADQLDHHIRRYALATFPFEPLANAQLDRVLFDGPDKFVPGVPYDFDFHPRPDEYGGAIRGTYKMSDDEYFEHNVLPGEKELLRAKAVIYSVVPPDNYDIWNGPRGINKRLEKDGFDLWRGRDKVLRAAAKFVIDVCAECGASEAKASGGLLLRCARCELTRYCSAECQGKHWWAHKYFCKYLRGGRYMK